MYNSDVEGNETGGISFEWKKINAEKKKNAIIFKNRIWQISELKCSQMYMCLICLQWEKRPYNLWQRLLLSKQKKIETGDQTWLFFTCFSHSFVHFVLFVSLLIPTIQSKYDQSKSTPNQYTNEHTWCSIVFVIND